MARYVDERCREATAFAVMPRMPRLIAEPALAAYFVDVANYGTDVMIVMHVALYQHSNGTKEVVLSSRS